jgi:hypothetical protein
MDGTYNANRAVYEGIETNAFTITGPFAFDQSTFWFSAGIGSASASGTAAPYTWTFNAASTADTTRSFSLEYAWSDGGASVPPSFRVPGNKVDTLSINWVKDSAVTFEVGVVSFKGMTQGTAISASPSDTVEQHALGVNTTVYIDGTAAIGTTADSNVAAASLEITNGFVRRFGLDGAYTGSALDRTAKTDAVLTMTRHFQNDTELDAWEAKDLRKVRIVTTGPTLGGGTYELRVDFYGVIDEIVQADVDGSVAQEITLRPYVDGSTVTVPFTVVLKNNTSTIS